MREGALFSEDGSRRLPFGVALAALFAILYAILWSGRYYHDGPFFLEKLEAGDLSYLHPLYLPAAEGLRRVLAVLGSPSAEGALRWLSIVSGAGVVAGSYAFGRASGNGRSSSALAAAVVGLAPAVVFYATIPEIHLFQGAVVVLSAAAVASAKARPAALFLAGAVACGAHLSSVLALPGLATLSALRGERRLRRFALDGLSAAAGCAALVAFLRWRPSEVGDLLALHFSPLATGRSPTPAEALPRLLEGFVLAFAFLGLAAAAAPAISRGPARAAGWLSWVWLLPLAASSVSKPFQLHGAYYLAGIPGLVLAFHAVARRVRHAWPGVRARTRALAFGVPLLAHAFLGLHLALRWGIDPARAFAEAVSSCVEEGDFVVADDGYRAFALSRRSRSRVFNAFALSQATAGEADAWIEAALPALRSRPSGATLSVDADTVARWLREGEPLGGIARLWERLENRALVCDGKLWRGELR